MASDFYTDSYSENLDALFAKKGVAHGVRRLIEAGIAAIHDDDDGALAAALDEMPINIDLNPVSAWPAGDSLLSYAARLSAPRCVTLLLSQGATLDLKLEGGDTALLTAVMQTPVVWESMGILKAEGGVSKAGVAAATRDRMARALDVLKRILGAGAAIDLADSDGYSPLLLSGHFGAPEFMSVLLDASAEVDQRADNGWTPLAQAASDGRLRCVELLVGAGAALDCGGLANAAGNGHGGCVKLLLAAGAGADCLDPGGQTSALWKAAKDGHLECVQLLLASGADAGLAVIKKSGDTDPIRGPGGGEGTTPFFMACQNGHLECAQLLLEAGAPVDKLRDFDGFSPLLIALCNSNRDCARLCVRAGADVNRVVRGGVTPLLVACQLGLLDACQLLSAFGASRAATPLGTPDQCAVHHKRADVAAWLAASRGPKWTHYVRNGAQVKSWLPLQHLEAHGVDLEKPRLTGRDLVLSFPCRRSPSSGRGRCCAAATTRSPASHRLSSGRASSARGASRIRPPRQSVPPSRSTLSSRGCR